MKKFVLFIMLSIITSTVTGVPKSPNRIPEKVFKVIEEIKKKNGSAPLGYQGGREFKNYDKILPTGIKYKEYDVNPYIKGKNRGAERLVIGADGSMWYTADHYKSFVRIR
jgi:guanyl-specific ribonuclease Sa